MDLKSIEALVSEEKHDFISLVSLLSILRSDNGCPWDREQSHKSIRKCLIEETYEVVEAIDTDNVSLLKEELGDLLFQVIFHSQIETEQGNFNIDDVISDICDKMIFRHPHVFGDRSVSNPEQVAVNWDDIKLKEKGQKSMVQSIKKVPPSMPALMKAQKIQSKARRKLNKGFASGEEALKFAIGQLSSGENNSIPKAVFALCAVADFEDNDIEKAVDDESKRFLDSL